MNFSRVVLAAVCAFVAAFGLLFCDSQLCEPEYRVETDRPPNGRVFGGVDCFRCCDCVDLSVFALKGTAWVTNAVGHQETACFPSSDLGFSSRVLFRAVHPGRAAGRVSMGTVWVRKTVRALRECPLMDKTA